MDFCAYTCTMYLQKATRLLSQTVHTSQVPLTLVLTCLLPSSCTCLPDRWWCSTYSSWSSSKAWSSPAILSAPGHHRGRGDLLGVWQQWAASATPIKPGTRQTIRWGRWLWSCIDVDPSLSYPFSRHRVQCLCQWGTDECRRGSGKEQCHHQRSAKETGEIKVTCVWCG